jgi:two-component system CheB/CheR fusion protein
MIVVGDDGNLTLANLQARHLFDVSARDLGRPFRDLELSYRPVELRAPIEQVRASGRPVQLRDIQWPDKANKAHWLDIHVSRITQATGQSLGTAVAFSDVTRYRELHHKLDQSRRELETAYEELQCTAEELETTNEELQSTNEELETTNEELQSTNEELETINDELRQRTTDLDQVNAYFESVLTSLRAAVAVLDRELRVQAWNDRAYQMWGLRGDDVQGEHFLNIEIGLPVAQLAQALRDCLADTSMDGAVVLGARTRTGKEIRCRVSCAPLGSRSGDILGAIVLMEELDGDE